MYIKFNAKAAGGGVIRNVTYENIYIDEPESWPIWIGPQQVWKRGVKRVASPCARCCSPAACCTCRHGVGRASQSEEVGRPHNPRQPTATQHWLCALCALYSLCSSSALHTLQAGIKEDGQSYNPCDGDPCSLCWPTLKSAACPGVAALIDGLTLRNITINKPKTSPGVINGNTSLPMRNIVFDGVRFIDPPADGAFGEDYFFCRGVASGVARGGTWPVPTCFTNETGASQ